MKQFNEISPFGFSQFITIDMGTGTMVIISGQTSIDNEGNTTGIGNFKEQTENIFRIISNILASAGGNMNDVVKLTNYLTDITSLSLFREVRDKYINLEKPPASCAVEVISLFKKDVLIEIEAMAFIPQK